METGWKTLQLLYQVYQVPNLEATCPGAGPVHRSIPNRPNPPYRKTVKAILRWSDEILAYHTTGRPTNGPIEATNNLLQKLKRTTHGFTNPQNGSSYLRGE